MRRLFLLALLFLTACTTTETPTSQPTATVVVTLPSATPNPPTVEPTVKPSPLPPTLAPTVSPTLTPTPYAPLQTDGPYFVYLKEHDGQQMLVMMDADGGGRRIITLPEAGYVSNLRNAISPDDHWLVFYTGTASDPRDANDTGSFNLTLKLLNLSTEQILTVTPLLSSDYPDNFRQTAELLLAQPPLDLPSKSIGALANYLQDAFLDGIYTFSWSANSRYLGFAGEMDGPSSDAYVYDLGSSQIWRLSSGPTEIQSLYWSENGTSVFQRSTYFRSEGEFSYFYETAIDGSYPLCQDRIGHSRA